MSERQHVYKKNPNRYDEVMDFIIKFKTENDGVSPTIREICDELRIKSVSHMSYVLRRLEGYGKIKRIDRYNSRCIMVIGGKWEYQQDTES